MKDSKCKICRRVGVKLFLKGEKCLSSKCPMVKKPYPPGQKRKRRTRALSEYGKELREKQKLKNWYNLTEQQFKKYVKGILGARGKVEDASRSACLEIIEALTGQGAEGIILGCTELPLLISPADVAILLFDTTRLHAEAAVERSLSE